MANGGAVGPDVRGGGTKKAGGMRVVRTVLLLLEVSGEREGARDECGSEAVDGGTGLGAMVGEATIAGRGGNA